MKIIKYEKKGNNKYKIHLENNESINVYEDVIIKNNLLYKKELDRKLLEKIDDDTLTNLTDDINDNSIVMKLEYNSFSCLFTGDISKKIEELLIKEYGTDLKSSILKVAHHRFKNIISKRIYKYCKP